VTEGKTTQDERVGPEAEPSRAPETGWSRLDDEESPPRPWKRAGFIDTLTGGIDDRPVVGDPSI
jgi:hypothetical protein